MSRRWWKGPMTGRRRREGARRRRDVGCATGRLTRTETLLRHGRGSHDGRHVGNGAEAGVVEFDRGRLGRADVGGAILRGIRVPQQLHQGSIGGGDGGGVGSGDSLPIPGALHVALLHHPPGGLEEGDDVVRDVRGGGTHATEDLNDLATLGGVEGGDAEQEDGNEEDGAIGATKSLFTGTDEMETVLDDLFECGRVARGLDGAVVVEPQTVFVEHAGGILGGAGFVARGPVLQDAIDPVRVVDQDVIPPEVGVSQASRTKILTKTPRVLEHFHEFRLDHGEAEGTRVLGDAFGKASSGGSGGLKDKDAGMEILTVGGAHQPTRTDGGSRVLGELGGKMKVGGNGQEMTDTGKGVRGRRAIGVLTFPGRLHFVGGIGSGPERRVARNELMLMLVVVVVLLVLRMMMMVMTMRVGEGGIGRRSRFGDERIGTTFDAG